MPLDPQTIARAIVEERNKGAEMSEKLERLLEMYKVCMHRLYYFGQNTYKS